VSVRIVQLITLAVACLVGFARPWNPSALLTALFFFGLTTLNAPDMLTGISATQRDLPPPLGVLLFIPGIASGLTSPFLFLFCITFPRRLIQSRWILALLSIPPVVWSIPSVIFGTRMAYSTNRAFGMLSETAFVAINVAAAAYFFAAPF